MSYAVLVIEDEELLGKNIRLYLERQGHDVRLASSAEAGLEMIEEFRPEAIVLDFNLPGMDGLEALGRIRRKDPDAVVVMMTGHGNEQIAVEAMKGGAYDYLTKPVALGKLKLVLERALSAERSREELAYHRRRAVPPVGVSALIGRSEAMERLRLSINRILEAERGLTGGDPPAVLIAGETGTGKELVARALHVDGPRASGPFVEINCATIPTQLLEAELFGHERGAFTDARERKLGLIEAANGGTLFLDEIGEIEPPLQVKLLKLLEDKRVRRLGSVREQQVSVRIVTATNRDLEQMVRQGRFRSDLFFRLRILQLSTPPLRDRGDDVLVLARHFLEAHRLRYGKPVLTFSDEAEQRLRQHRWPGNVRELRNVIEHSVIMVHGTVIEARDLMLAQVDAEPQPASAPDPVPARDESARGAVSDTLPEMERQMLLRALEGHRWNVTRAARALGVSRDTLRYRIEKFQLRPPEGDVV
ncbi:MAG: sigma-54-dependent Fis family transcriptional regulator [Burkholderiaceae bacterium]|nr:sigma-54-dependent Fis family transcriptional regulator [Burkholderiaceae bacterium]MBP6816248.1 sigma-54-dependent Fis family transcriptional regulator [Burkholderiaceae bacterium]